jgi:hypothetical protein
MSFRRRKAVLAGVLALSLTVVPALVADLGLSSSAAFTSGASCVGGTPAPTPTPGPTHTPPPTPGPSLTPTPTPCPTPTPTPTMTPTPTPTLPTSKEQCKKGGWQTFGVFKNQGDCVSFVATAGKNPPDG